MVRNPCLTCGACCVLFRVSFHWMESDDATPDGVPAQFTEPAPVAHRLMMKGTGSEPVRCVCLSGEPGRAVGCTIHPRRPSPCREFAMSFEDGVTHNPRCDEARARIGLAPLEPDWNAPPEDDGDGGDDLSRRSA